MKFCECGCGSASPIATRTRTWLGWTKGEPTRFIPGHQSRGSCHPNFRGHPKKFMANGYIAVHVGNDHPLAYADGYAYEHRVVASEALGRYVEADEDVHHIDGDKRNNQVENLEVLPREVHLREHAMTTRRRTPAGAFA